LEINGLLIFTLEYSRVDNAAVSDACSLK